MYVASSADKAWLLSVQSKLFQRSQYDLDFNFRRLWGFVTDLRNLRCAFATVAANKGRRTAGVDGVTDRRILSTEGGETFCLRLRALLRSRHYRPGPVRQVRIPKAGKPGKFRTLGIPTVIDRVVQAAIKAIAEPIFEADFYPCSYGFRPRRSVHGALRHLWNLLRPRLRNSSDQVSIPYQVVLEGDIKACFDNISHQALMDRWSRRIGDGRLNRLLRGLLKAGILAEGSFIRSEAGVPQGSILSPLLANIALEAIEERYERQVWPRRTPTPTGNRKTVDYRARRNRAEDRKNEDTVFFPIRYADDFVVLVGAPPGPDQIGAAFVESRKSGGNRPESLAGPGRHEAGLPLQAGYG